MTLLLIIIFVDHYFEAVSAVKLLQYVIANLHFKGKVFFETHCIVGISCSGRATLSSNSREIGCKSRIGLMATEI